MTTSFMPLDLIEAESEFDKACEQRWDNCPNEARWMAYADHGNECVPVSVRCCDQCKEWSIQRWTEALGKLCKDCLVPLTGQLSDHLRFIAL